MKLAGSILIAVASMLFVVVSAQAAGTVVSILKVDETTVNGTLVGLEDGKIILSAPSAKIPLEDLVQLTPKGSAAAGPINSNIRKLTGKVLGTDGSYHNEGNVRSNAFDGDLMTFFDSPESDGSWVGLDLGSPKVVTLIKYSPRQGKDIYLKRMLGAQFQGSNTADFSGSPVTLFTVSSQPVAGKLTEQAVNIAQACRYVRYLSPPNSSGNVAEIEFWGKDADGKATAPKSEKLQANTRSDLKLPSTKRATTSPAAQAVAGTLPATLPAQSTVRVVLSNGESFGGPLLGWSEKQLRLGTPYGDADGLDIPMEILHEVWKGTPEQVKQAKAISLEPGPEDAAFVGKDNGVVVVRGVTLGVNGESLRFKFNADERKINLNKLVGVILGSNEATKDGSLRQTVQLTNGDSVTGSWTRFDDATGTVALKTPWGAMLNVPIRNITRISSANGRLMYLGDMKPAAVEQTPYFDRMLTYRVDKSLTGGPLKLSDGEVARGIAVHSRTVLTYEIAGAYEDFKTKVGFQQPEGKLGQAVIRVSGDGKVLYENLDARGDAKPVDLSVKVTGVQRLVLEVDFGKNEDTGDRVVWANARLLRAKK